MKPKNLSQAHCRAIRSLRKEFPDKVFGSLIVSESYPKALLICVFDGLVRNFSYSAATLDRFDRDLAGFVKGLRTTITQL